MKKYLFVLLMLVAGCARAADDWSRTDWNRQLAYTALHIADWTQTRYIATHPEQYHELNPLLGTHPTLGYVNNYFALGLIGHWAITYMLPAHYRPIWQYGSIAVEGYFVLHNRSIGISMKF